MTAAAAAKQERKVDLNLIASQIHVALTELKGSEQEAERNEQLVNRYATVAESARAVATRRRVEIGELLLRARPMWPERGTGTADHTIGGKLVQRWGEFLALVGVDDSTARRYMDEASDPDAKRGAKRERTRIDAILAEVRKLGREDRKLLMAELKPVNVSGGSGESDRGAWITARKWTERVGAWDVDPFSNPRSTLEATVRCMLENNGNGLADVEIPGSWIAGGDLSSSGVADENTKVWGQPPYDIVEAAVAHYRHTRFCFLLRLDPSTGWFETLWERTNVLAIPLGDREMFEPPPGVEASSNPQPHAFYYANPEDITPAIAETCILLDRYHARPLLEVVR